MAPSEHQPNAEIVYRLVRWGLAVVFICAGSIKLLEPVNFATLIDAYGIVPERFLLPVAIMLPALEVAAGIGLLFDMEGCLAVIGGLLVLFIAILAYGIWMGLDVDCGCFGPEDLEAEAFHDLRPSLYRDVAMLVGVAIMYMWRRVCEIRPHKVSWLVKMLRKPIEVDGGNHSVSEGLPQQK